MVVSNYLLAWLALILIVVLARAVLLQQYVIYHQKTGSDQNRWAWRFTVTSGLTGCA